MKLSNRKFQIHALKTNSINEILLGRDESNESPVQITNVWPFSTTVEQSNF